MISQSTDEEVMALRAALALERKQLKDRLAKLAAMLENAGEVLQAMGVKRAMEEVR